MHTFVLLGLSASVHAARDLNKHEALKKEKEKSYSDKITTLIKT